MSTEYDLIDEGTLPSVSKVNKEKGQSWKPAKPKPDAGMLYDELTLVRNSLLCSDWRAAAYHGYRCADIWAELRDAEKTALWNDFPDAPDPLGDWGGAGWVVYATTWAYWFHHIAPNPTIPRTEGITCPKHSTLIHDR
jgi:hypothetical protein